MSLEGLLAQDTITIQRPVIVSDDAGGFNQNSWDTIASGVPARVDIMSGNQKMMFAQLQIEVSHTVYTQYTGLRNGDKILTSDNKKLRVVGITKRNAFGNIPLLVDVPCVEILEEENHLLHDSPLDSVILHAANPYDTLDWS